MLDKNNKRMLAYVVTIDEIKPIPDYDRVEHARVGGWWCIVKKDEFNVGDKAIYFEVDSKVPSDDKRFEFLASKHYKIKTQKMCKVYSQGLIMPLSEFPELNNAELHTDVTDILGVTYSVKEDNRRKANHDPNAKYKNMASRHKKLAKYRWFRWLMKREWGKKLLFVFLGKHKDKPKQWPSWIKKTDEERIENMTWVLKDKEPFVVTEKIDGTSTTFFLDNTSRKPEFGVCSRNVRQMDEKQENYHTAEDVGNVYWEMAFKYNVNDALEKIAKEHNVKQLVLQGETYGASVQGNPYKIDERRFAAFNLVFDGVRLGSVEAKKILDAYDIPFVPIINEDYILPDDFEEFKLSADGMSTINNKCRQEGYVYRKADGSLSFKNVSREFLLKRKD